MGISVAMWSGPRNISTAMMRSWENRSDCHVVDEPFYAHFLKHTGLEHPMAERIVQTHNHNLEQIIELVSTPPATGVFYQKHISTHMLEHIPLNWLDSVHNVFLIRDPRYMVASYTAKRSSTNASDLGYAQLADVFEQAKDTSNTIPLVIDSKRFLDSPEAHLRIICDQLGIEFEPSMLQWPAGERSSDGIWHEHWYDAVKASTGFGPSRSDKPSLNSAQEAVVDECMPYYDRLSEHALHV